MALKSVLVNALQPHKDTLSNWESEDLELLFMGFGNISIYFKDDDPILADNLAGTFKGNAQGIVDALNELELNRDWTIADFYWLISANAGEVRSDLVNVINDAGFVCYDYFDAEENPEPQPVTVFEAEPSLISITQEDE